MDESVPMETGGQAAQPVTAQPASAGAEASASPDPPASAPAVEHEQPQPPAATPAAAASQPEARKPAAKADGDEAKAVAKGAKKQKVVAEEYAAMAPDQWPVRPYLEKFVAPLLMEAMQAVVKERPEKPLLFMAEWLIKADKAGAGPGTPGNAEKGAAAAAPQADGATAADQDIAPQPAQTAAAAQPAPAE